VTTTSVEPLPSDPFTLGVASGDPLPDRVILWTRLAPDPLRDGGMPPEAVPVRWEVAADEAFSRIVADGEATAEPTYAHTVHVDAGGLDPGTPYWYRFRAGGFTSPVGATRTAPDGGTDPLRFAFASCQNYKDGFYTAYPHLVADGVDLVMFLGDYIYESGPSDGRPRNHDGPEVTTLPAYRNRYALYKGDGGLQAAHAAAPWFVTWDDHEVDNNYAGDHGGDGEAADQFLARRAAAYQAWWEHQPVRLDPPTGASYTIYRSLEWGDLATVFALDGRQYRSVQACGGELGPVCPELDDPSRTFLGAEQEAWLLDGLQGATSRWKVLANDVVMADSVVHLGDSSLVNPDQWDGYPLARQRILQAIADGAIADVVAITGDIHASAVADLELEGDGEPSVVATEFVGTSISSSFPDGLIAGFEALAALRPNVRWTNARQRGYVVCELEDTTWRTDYRLVDNVATPTASVATGSSWIVDTGLPGAREA
jgi:alkaline phosphatase D